MTAESNEIDSLQFILYSDRLELAKPTGISEFEPRSIKLFPNPTSDILSVISPKVVTQVTMYDQSGRIPRELSPKSMRFHLDVKSVSNGIYFMEMVDDCGALHHAEVVILR